MRLSACTLSMTLVVAAGLLGAPSAGAAPPDATAKSPEIGAASKSRQTWLSAEDLRLGDFKAPANPFPFPLLGDEKAKEIYVDRGGKLYKERPYQGLVPDWRTRRPDESFLRGKCKVVAQQLTWVGFQNNRDSSRVFVQVSDRACGYVYRPDANHIVIDLPAVSVASANLRRDILTGAFPTPVSLVHIEELKGRGTRVVIALKTRQRYLSAHLGRYVFVDVSR